VSELLIGSSIIIKNGVGVAGILAVLLLCAAPLVKMAVLLVLYRVAAAVIQPLADKRISGCVSGMGEGAGLFWKILVTAMGMLLLTIALVVASTTWNR
jgi:stage III sporulation protein AE